MSSGKLSPHRQELYFQFHVLNYKEVQGKEVQREGEAMMRREEKLKWHPIGPGAIRGALESKQTPSAEEDKQRRQAALFARAYRRFWRDAYDVAGAGVGPEDAVRHEIIGQEIYGETLERFVVQLLEIAWRCTDLLIERDLRKLANDLVHVIESCDQSETTRQSH